jgi:hypothetical protein
MAFFTPFAFRRISVGIPPTPPSYDQDAINFFNATGITDAGLKGAVDTFVVALKNTGSLWDNMVQICPLVADDTSSLATMFAVNLRNTGSYSLTFPNGVGASSDLNGFYANEASTIYANTNLAPRTVFGSLGDYSVGIYTTTAGETGDAWDWGGFSSNSNYSYFIVGRSLSGGNVGVLSGLRPDNICNAGTLVAAGGFFNSRFDNGASPKGRYAKNATQIASSNGGSGDIANFNAFLGSGNFSGSPASKCDKQYQMLTVGNGLTDAQMTSLNTIVQNFQDDVDTALGTSRKV